MLDPAEARAAEGLVLGRAGRLTPAGLRSAIARAVMEVAPDKARKRREKAERDARVERWAEDSGNAALMGRELPPAKVLAADQRITAWARELKKAGLEGSMDELRARAYLDILLDKDSRPDQNARVRRANQPDCPAGHPAQPGEAPGEIPGIGPVDPALARDLACSAAQNPKTTWCVTVTDEQGHAIGHGCARPEPEGHHPHREKRGPPGPRDGPGFAFTASGGLPLSAILSTTSPTRREILPVQWRPAVSAITTHSGLPWL